MKEESDVAYARALARLGGRPPSASLARALLAPQTQREQNKCKAANKRMQHNQGSARSTQKKHRSQKVSQKQKIFQLVSHLLTAILSGLAGFFGAT